MEDVVPLASYQADCGLIYAGYLFPQPFRFGHSNFERQREAIRVRCPKYWYKCCCAFGSGFVWL